MNRNNGQECQVLYKIRRNSLEYQRSRGQQGKVRVLESEGDKNSK